MNPDTGIQNTRSTRDMENSSYPHWLKQVYTNLSQGEIYPVVIDDKAIFGKKIAGLRNNPEKQLVKLWTVSVEE